MLTGLLISYSLISLWIVVQVLVFHIFSVRDKFKTLTVLFLPTLPVFGLAYWSLSGKTSLLEMSDLIWFGNGLFVHCLLYGAWVQFFYAVERPVTLRILEELSKSPDQTLSISQMQEIYGLGHMISRRLDALVSSGYCIEKEGRYFLTGQGRAFAVFFKLGRHIFHANVRP